MKKGSHLRIRAPVNRRFDRRGRKMLLLVPAAVFAASSAWTTPETVTIREEVFEAGVNQGDPKIEAGTRARLLRYHHERFSGRKLATVEVTRDGQTITTDVDAEVVSDSKSATPSVDDILDMGSEQISRAAASAPPPRQQSAPSGKQEFSLPSLGNGSSACRTIDRRAEASFDSAWLNSTPVSHGSPPRGRGGVARPGGSVLSATRRPASADHPAPMYEPSIFRRRSHHLEVERAIDDNIRHTGSIQTAGGANQPVRPDHIGTLQHSQQVGELARGRELVELAMERRRALENAARRDTNVLTQTYAEVPMEEFATRMGTAQRELSRSIRDLETATSGLDSGDAAVTSRVYMNARDKAAIAQNLIGDELNRRSLDPVTAFKDLFNNAAKGNGSEAASALAELFPSIVPDSAAARAGATGIDNPLSQDAAADRAMLYHGLPPEQRGRIMKDLRLAENRKLSLPGGATRDVAVLHRGYLFGGGKSGMDCSIFVSRSLPADIRKGAFTTLDFVAMWYYRRNGKLPNPPTYKNNRDKLVRDTAENFIAVDVTHGEQLAIGDVLVFRSPSRPVGHVFVVTDYDPVAMEAEVIEAAQSSGTVMRRKLPLTTAPPSAPVRRVRVGLYALRLKPDQTPSCKQADARGGSREPASQRRPGGQGRFVPNLRQDSGKGVAL